MSEITRRRFLQAAAIAAASVPLSNVLKARAAEQQADIIPKGSFQETQTVTGGVCEMCFWRCQLVGKVRNGRLVKLEGNPKSIDNGKAICARGNAGIMLAYDPNRLKYPMKNIGERGNPKWQRISWEEALDECAKRLKDVMDKYGPQGICMYPHGASAKYPMDFFETVIGTPNISEASFFQCRGVRDQAYLATYGHTCDENVDMANAKVIFLTGSHLGENIHVSHTMSYLKGLENGAKLIVIDPRFSASASKADIWLSIRPGTDTALLLAIMNHLITKNLYDKAFVQANCSGFDEFKKACSQWTVKKAAKECDIPEAQIITVAELLAKNAPHVSIHPGRFSSWYGNDFQRIRALACLTALLGAYRVPGGFTNPISPKTGSVKWKDTKEPNEKVNMAEKWPFHPPGTPTDAIRDAAITGKPYPIKATVIWGQNIIQTIPNQQKTIEALKRQDFVLCVDIMPTDVTMYADILLPEPTYLERYDVIKKGGKVRKDGPDMQYIAARMPLIEPLHDTKDGIYITNEIAKRMGFEKHIPVKDQIEYVNKMLDAAALSIEKLRAEDGIHVEESSKKAYRKDGEALEFETPSGKIELFSKDLAEKGFPGAPTYLPAPKRPKGYAQLLFGRTPVHSFSRTQNNLWLHNEMPENAIWINEKMAKRMGLKDGERVKLINQDGMMSRTDTIVLITPGIREDAVFLPHGYGMQNPLLEVAANKGMDDQSLCTANCVDPQTGTHGIRANFVKIVKDGKPIDFPV